MSLRLTPVPRQSQLCQVFFFFFLSGPDGDQYGAMRTRKWGPDDFCYANTHDTQWINHLKTCLFPIPLAGSVAVVFWSCSLVVL